jgi:hypothetical protein
VPTHPVDVAHLRLLAQRIERPASTTPEAVVTHLGALQAQDYQGALWSIGLRIAGATRADVERAIADRRIVRTWPMRGTLHFVPAIDARWMLELLTPRVMQSAAGRHRQLELDDATFARSRAIIGRALKDQAALSRSAILGVLDQGGVSTPVSAAFTSCSGFRWNGCSATAHTPGKSRRSHCSTIGSRRRVDSSATRLSARWPSATS